MSGYGDIADWGDRPMSNWTMMHGWIQKLWLLKGCCIGWWSWAEDDDGYIDAEDDDVIKDYNDANT